MEIELLNRRYIPSETHLYLRRSVVPQSILVTGWWWVFCTDTATITQEGFDPDSVGVTVDDTDGVVLVAVGHVNTLCLACRFRRISWCVITGSRLLGWL